LIADRRHAAEHDVVHALGIEPLVADQHLVHQADHQVDRLRGVQRPVALPLAPRGANRVEDQCLSAQFEVLLEVVG
jgi:hypothetical protein